MTRKLGARRVVTCCAHLKCATSRQLQHCQPAGSIGLVVRAAFRSAVPVCLLTSQSGRINLPLGRVGTHPSTFLFVLYFSRIFASSLNTIFSRSSCVPAARIFLMYCCTSTPFARGTNASSSHRSGVNHTQELVPRLSARTDATHVSKSGEAHGQPSYCTDLRHG